MAEGVGFKPTSGGATPLADLQSTPINHSGIPPHLRPAIWVDSL